MPTTRSIAGRSNRKTEVLFVGATGTHADKIHGGGFGAFVKMADRASFALTGWTTRDTRTTWAAETDQVTFTHRTTAEALTFTVLMGEGL